MSKRLLYRLVWVPSAIALAAVLVLLPPHRQALSAPGPMTAFAASDGSFSISHPDNWKPHEESEHGVSAEVQFTPGDDAFMRVTMDLQGSLLADIDRGAGSVPDVPGLIPGGGAAPAGKSPLEKAHARTQESLAEEWETFKPGDTKHVQVGGLDALSTEFTYRKKSEGFGTTPRRGRFINALANSRSLTILYHCTDETGIVDKMTPVFEKMVQSLRFGQGG